MTGLKDGSIVLRGKAQTTRGSSDWDVNATSGQTRRAEPCFSETPEIEGLIGNSGQA
jgi:hypothetical protein